MMAKRLKQLREERCLSKKEVAEYLNVSPSTYGKYELEKRQPDFETLSKLAEYYDVSVDYILGLSNIRKVDEAFYAFIERMQELDEETKSDVIRLLEHLISKKNK